MKRKLRERIQDRLWREMGRLLIKDNPPLQGPADAEAGSISSSMPWVAVCAALAKGSIGNRHFRRLRAVRQVVETVGPVDAGFYAGRIREWGPEWLEHPGVCQVDAWGDPVRLPGMYLGTPRAFSPTSLRYLATALWLKREGLLTDGDELLEIGVGFGGLAGMNGLVSKTHTKLVDLPQVAEAAMRMLRECGLENHASIQDGPTSNKMPLVISNYAFTELSADLQDCYLDTYLKHARHGMIISNATVFARSIGGRSDDDLMAWLRNAGIPAVIEDTNPLLSPIDAVCGVRLIRW